MTTPPSLSQTMLTLQARLQRDTHTHLDALTESITTALNAALQAFPWVPVEPTPTDAQVDAVLTECGVTDPTARERQLAQAVARARQDRAASDHQAVALVAALQELEKWPDLPEVPYAITVNMAGEPRTLAIPGHKVQGVLQAIHRHARTLAPYAREALTAQAALERVRLADDATRRGAFVAGYMERVHYTGEMERLRHVRDAEALYEDRRAVNWFGYLDA